MRPCSIDRWWVFRGRILIVKRRRLVPMARLEEERLAKRVDGAFLQNSLGDPADLSQTLSGGRETRAATSLLPPN